MVAVCGVNDATYVAWAHAGLPRSGRQESLSEVGAA